MLVAESPASATFFCSDCCVLSSCSERRPIGLRPPSDQIANAARRLMLRDKACVTTIICIKIYS